MTFTSSTTVVTGASALGLHGAQLSGGSFKSQNVSQVKVSHSHLASQVSVTIHKSYLLVVEESHCTGELTVYYGKQVNISDSVFQGSSQTPIVLHGQINSVTLSRCSFDSNNPSSSSSTGAISASSVGLLSIVNSTFASNNVWNGFHVLQSLDSSISIQSCTFFGNGLRPQLATPDLLNITHGSLQLTSSTFILNSGGIKLNQLTASSAVSHTSMNLNVVPNAQPLLEVSGCNELNISGSDISYNFGTFE